MKFSVTLSLALFLLPAVLVAQNTADGVEFDFDSIKDDCFGLRLRGARHGRPLFTIHSGSDGDWDCARHMPGLSLMLGFKKAENGTEHWPRVRKRSWIHGPDFPVTIVDLGVIRPPEAELLDKHEKTGWASAAYTCVYAEDDAAGEEYEIEFRVSRLSPAMVVSCSGPEVLLYADVKDWTLTPGNYGFNAGKKTKDLPAYMAAAPGDAAAVARIPNEEQAIREQCVTEQPLDLQPAAFGKWMLAWHGANSKFRGTRHPGFVRQRFRESVSMIDCPMLFVFENEPDAVSFSYEPEAGIRFSFADNVGRIAVMPLFGEDYPEAQVTEKWRNGLPPEVVARCEYWAGLLCRIPADVSESWSFDADSGTITYKEKFQYLDVRPGGELAAPVSPMVMLGRRYGLQIAFSSEPADPAFVTPYGPLGLVEGTDEYSFTLSGMDKYVSRRRRTGDKPVPAALEEELRAEIRKALDAGDLAPWFVLNNTATQFYIRGFVGIGNRSAQPFGNPGETLYFLSEFADLLDPDTRAEVESYARSWQQRFPAHKIAHLPTLDPDLNSRLRHDFHFNEHTIGLGGDRVLDLPDRAMNFFVACGFVPPENLYYLDRFHDMTGEPIPAELWNEYREISAPYVLNMDWPSLGFFSWEIPGKWPPAEPNNSLAYFGRGGSDDVNRMFSGMLGYARLARRAGDAAAEAKAMGLFGKAAMLRCGLDKFKEFLYGRGLLEAPADPQWMYGDRIGAGGLMRRVFGGLGDDPTTAYICNEYGIILFDTPNHFWQTVRLHPYLYMTPELGVFLSDYSGREAAVFADAVAELMPDWHIALCEQNLGSEVNYLFPEDSYQTFMAHAWILRRPPEWLEQRLDVSWTALGDYYYMHKLAETIRAYKGWE